MGPYMEQQKEPLKEKSGHSGGIPVQMKRKLEKASGYSLGKVRVHYNSSEPARLDAHSYAQGDDVYLSPGRDGDLQHELIHVIQQKQGLVRPTGRIGGVPVNTSPRLEAMADRGIVTQEGPRVSGGAPVAQRIPNIGSIAVRRFRERTEGARMFDGLARQVQLGILQEELSPALVGRIVTMFPGNGSFQYQNVLYEIYAYYDTSGGGAAGPGIQTNLGADVGRLEPAAVNLPYLTALSTALQNILLPKVRNAEQKGRRDRANIRPPVGIGSTFTNSIGGVGAIRWQDPRVGREMREDIVEGTARFNELLRPRRGGRRRRRTVLPDVHIGHRGLGATTYASGRMDYGAAAGPSQVVHEMGHHLENNLSVRDFAVLHNFLRARTRPRNGGETNAGHGVLGMDLVGTYGKGYDAELPPMVFQNYVSRNILKSWHSLGLFGVYNLGNWGLSGIWRLFGARERGQQFIDDFFLQDSNSESTSYATMTRDTAGNTEFVSTTAELLATARGAAELIRTDPLRATLFVYLSNKPLYAAVKGEFRNVFRAQNPGQNPPSLDDLIHIV